MNSNTKEIKELSDGWVLCRSKKNPGRQYYFNRRTGKSSWTDPQPSTAPAKNVKKNEKDKPNPAKRKSDEARNKAVKRISDGASDEAGSFKKKQKNESPQKPKPSPSKKESPKPNTKPQHSRKSDTPNKRRSFNKTTPKSTPSSNTGSPLKTPPAKNIANNRLSQLRAQLSAEAHSEAEKESPQKRKSSPKQNDTPARPRTELPPPSFGESNSTVKSPSSDSLQSIPSPSQFFAANKIICSMKAQLLEEFSNQEKPKDTFADIEQGICSQMTEYPVIKHPSTPPQFSEASKLVSAIKSKLSYSPNVKTFATAKDRMEALRASVSGEGNETQSDTKTKEASPQKCEAMEVEEIKEAPNQMTPTGSSIHLPTQHNHRERFSDNGQVVLVVDTNIFIHELDFIRNVLNSHIKGYSEQPMLIVPWRVINELDRLKDNNNGNGAICKRARAAMDFLYKSLPENSRIKGQSLRDANSHIYPCELPDDEILNCSLQQAERGRNVVLLSNDKNLCNKASLNGIRRMSILELKQLVEQAPTREEEPDRLASVAHCAAAIYRLLASILENEMQAKYGNLWRHVVFKAPPWTLADVLQCLLKHWMAVFNEVFPRIEHLVTDLKNVHASIVSKDPKTLTQSEVGHFKEVCTEVGRRCQIIPEYMQLAKTTVKLLASSPSANEIPDEQGRQRFLEAFEALWTASSSYCAKLSTALGVPHRLEDTVSGTESLDRLKDRLGTFRDSVTTLVTVIEGVLKSEDKSSWEDRVGALHEAFLAALRRVALHTYSVTRDQIREFCLTDRGMLQEALNKFSQVNQLFEVCASTISSRFHS